MNKFLMGVAATVLILSSCAQNDILNTPGVTTPNDGKIRFAASTGLNTKGNPFNSTGDLQKLGFFTVKGYVEGVGSDLINSDMEWNTAFSSWEYKQGEAPYWPSTWMDFYAFANWSPVIDAENGTIYLEKVKIDADDLDNNGQNGQKDLLVAITPNATKELRTLLTFKHALTQIVFKAGNVNADKLDVNVTGVDLVNVNNTGDMEMKKTDQKVIWTNQKLIDSYKVQGIDAFSVPEINNPTNYSLFPRIQTVAAPNDNALMLIPQKFNAWNPTSGLSPNDKSSGASIKVSASLCDKEKVTLDNLKNATTESDAKELQKYVYCGIVEPKGGDYANGCILSPGTLYIPVDSKEGSAGVWDAGKRINYIISFGDAGAGSGGGGYEEDGDPVLVTIKFRAVVEDWTEATIPLLTANINATSTAITHEFIDGFTNQLLSDIENAAFPKVFSAKFTFNGATSAQIKTNLLNATVPVTQNQKFLPGSTLTYDMTKVDVTNGNAIFLLPDGWKVKSGSLVVDNLTPLVLEKLATSGYNFTARLGYIQDYLNALELNESGSITKKQGSTITVNGEVNNHFVFSTESLAKIVGAVDDFIVTIDMKNVTGWGEGKDVTTWCPAGWKASIGIVTNNYAGGTNIFAGETILLTEPSVITFKR